MSGFRTPFLYAESMQLQHHGTFGFEVKLLPQESLEYMLMWRPWECEKGLGVYSTISKQPHSQKAIFQLVIQISTLLTVRSLNRLRPVLPVGDLTPISQPSPQACSPQNVKNITVSIAIYHLRHTSQAWTIVPTKPLQKPLQYKPPLETVDNPRGTPVRPPETLNP